MGVYKKILKEKLIRYYQPIIYISCLLILVGLYGYFGIKAYANVTSKELSDQVMRFHVVANSDTTYDQLLKEDVRDAVLSYMRPKLEDAKDKEESRAIIQENQAEIEQISADTIARWGEDYSVQVQITDVKFPTKAYGDVVLPAGEYEACQIVIGQGKGENWWCIMFPPLCYVDAASGTVPLEGKEELRANLSEEQYNIVTPEEEESYQVRFKILEWFGR